MEITHSKTMRIPLTQGKFAIVDAEHYEYLNQWKWYYNGRYAVRTDRTNGQRTIWLHRVVLERMGFKDFKEGDHINRNKLDNRQCNLRTATHRQNCCNQVKRGSTTSGYIGVYWYKRLKKWVAQISVNNKRKYLGLFGDKKEAARVYNLAARMYYGDFSVLNKV